ncbi:MAG: putative protein N(5)-glutamine methyltransferase [Jatrophihabitans sp.]|nr:MAG: putative protein N(5)-glutamine methyltransferase [Jatrophihabitans sp.]
MGDALVQRLRAAGCVFAEQEAALLRGSASGPDLEALVARRVAGTPLEHLLGWVEWGGRRLAVAPGVFVPRRRTVLLATLAAQTLAPGGILVELCCGAAPVAATVAGEAYACDLDPAAVACARRNLPAGRAFAGDLYDALPSRLRGRVDVLVANAPYVPTSEVALMPREARLYESRLALDGGADGMDVQRRVIAGAAPWLSPAGVLVIETSRAQAAAGLAALRAAGFAGRVVRDDGLAATALVAATRQRR